jgi:thioredoxin-related protein
VKIPFTFLALFTFLWVGAQDNEPSKPGYLLFPTVPPFNIITVPDSLPFTKADLKKRKPVMIVYFSPDCDHCKHFTKELLNRLSLFKKVQIVMASALDHNLIKKFYTEYQLGDHSSIKIGRDGIDFLRDFFRIKSYPTIALYDKKGNLIGKFDGSTPIEQLAEQLKTKH